MAPQPIFIAAAAKFTCYQLAVHGPRKCMVSLVSDRQKHQQPTNVFHTITYSNMTEHNEIYPPDDASQQAFFIQASQNPSQYNNNNNNNDHVNCGAPHRQNLAFHDSNFSPVPQAGLVYRPHLPHVFPQPGCPCSPHTIPSSSVNFKLGNPLPTWVQPNVNPAAKPTTKCP